MPDNADETVTVRLPKGTADKLRAATGQPFSRLVRFLVIALLEKKAAEGASARLDAAQDAAAVVNQLEG